MKRPRGKLAMLLVLLCGGAIINIAGAWGCCAWRWATIPVNQPGP